jgi:hypothetical protein
MVSLPYFFKEVSMNCKENDIAMIKYSIFPQNIGIPVICLKLVPYEVHMMEDDNGTRLSEPVWEVDRPLYGEYTDGTPAYSPYIQDSRLLPIGKKQTQQETTKQLENVE